MSRRDFVRLGLATVIAARAGGWRPAFGAEARASVGAANFALRIAPMIVELAPRVVVSTIGYNDTIPGPLLRMR